jgi:tetratricopeptide (TPR) repeat protein
MGDNLNRGSLAIRIALGAVCSLCSLPFLTFGGYLLSCWFRIHITNSYYVDYPYFLLGTACVAVGVFCLWLVIFAPRLRSFTGLWYLIPCILAFCAMVIIPEVQPRGMYSDSEYLGDVDSYFQQWHEEHNAFPANESEFAKALAECPAAWHRHFPKPQSKYRQRGVALPYQVIVISNAPGPRLNQLSDRPGVIYYSVSADLQEFWATMTSLNTEVVASSASIERLGGGSDSKISLAQGDGRGYPRDEKALQDYRLRLKTDPSLSHTIAETQYHLGVVYMMVQRWNDAEAAFRESLSIRQELEKSHPEWSPPDIATTLNSLGDLYRDSSRLKEAEIAYKDALEIRRKLAKEEFEWYTPGLARTLSGLGSIYARTNRLADAKQAYIEALTLRRKLMKANPIAYAPDVAFTLSDLGSLYKSEGHAAESARACGESTNIFRQLAATDQATYSPLVGTVCEQ